MSWSRFLPPALSALILFSGVTAALPANTSRESAIAKRAYSCFDIQYITTKYLYENTCYDPLPSTCLFYTRGESNNARVFAHKDGAHFTTIWEMWDQPHYDDDVNDDKNRMRCIMRNQADRNTYFRRMSDAMALKCDLFATVMSAEPKPDVPKRGIWYRTEYPRLRQTKDQRHTDAPWVGDNYKKQVDRIEYIRGPNGDDVSTDWSRGMPNPPRSVADANITATAPLVRRDPACGAPPGRAGVFDIGGALPVNW